MGGLMVRLVERLRCESRENCAYWLFVMALIIQIPHLLEHASQLHQFFLGMKMPQGLVGAHFDFVWVHFAYNLLFFATVAGMYLVWRRDPKGWRVHTWGGRLLLAAVVWQGYHMVEHSLQMMQYMNGIQRPPGLLGGLLPNIILHFDLNLVALLLVVFAAFGLRPRRLPVGPTIFESRAAAAVPKP
jgi:uncharacterized membrane protein